MHLKQKLKHKKRYAVATRHVRGPNSDDLSSILIQTLTVLNDPTRMRLRLNCEKKEDMLVTINEAATLLAVSRSTVYRLIQEGMLKRVYLKGAPRITRLSICDLTGERDD